MRYTVAMQLRQVGSGPNISYQPLHSSNLAPGQSPQPGPRRAAPERGFTLVETMVATVLLSMMILGILQVLIGSYRLAAKARYNDHARYIIKSLADQFLTEQTTYTTGAQGGDTISFFSPTGPTGTNLTWVQTLPNGSQSTINGGPLPGGLQVPLSDYTTGEAPITATVSYQVWNIDPSTGEPTTGGVVINSAAGALLRADFTVTFPYQGQTLSQTISVIRATP
jgi:prepilin-type N-terminal cleavage/methylation domain-containing protein